MFEWPSTVFLPDGREALVTARVEAVAGPLAALLDVVVAPSRLDGDDAARALVAPIELRWSPEW